MMRPLKVCYKFLEALLCGGRYVCKGILDSVLHTFCIVWYNIWKMDQKSRSQIWKQNISGCC